MEKLEYRMYGLVPYNISPIQQGIQFGHAVVEYGLSYSEDHSYQNWAHNDKTFIRLNGGTTNNNKERYGTLNNAKINLHSLGVQIATFSEPDLGDQLTAIVFLVDERIYDYTKYPTYDYIMHEGVGEITYYDNIFGKDAEHILDMRDFLSKYKLA